MYLIIYINEEDNKIYKIIPSDEEFSNSIGDFVELDNFKHVITNIITEEFSDYELIIYRILVTKVDKESILDEFTKEKSI